MPKAVNKRLTKYYCTNKQHTCCSKCQNKACAKHHEPPSARIVESYQVRIIYWPSHKPCLKKERAESQHSFSERQKFGSGYTERLYGTHDTQPFLGTINLPMGQRHGFGTPLGAPKAGNQSNDIFGVINRLRAS